MYYFHNDYNEICHPNVLKHICDNIGKQMNGYGEDTSCSRAAERIRLLCGSENIAVHFLVGGTQTNLTVIASALRPHQAVMAADSGHIQVHETGAIEATGHKVIPLPSEDGKISADQIAAAVHTHWTDATHEHMPQPKMVYISQPTEFGTVYTLNELEAISQVCRTNGMYLFVDGARLGYALTSRGNDIHLPDLARLTDVFYIGGTKVGAMLGEAVVITNTNIQEDFRYIMKQRGAMLAKGWLLGLQFEALLEDRLYWEIARYANDLADKIRNTLSRSGYLMPVISATNQVFASLPVSVYNRLANDFMICPWSEPDGGYITVRFCTSWSTTDESVAALCKALENN